MNSTATHTDINYRYFSFVKFKKMSKMTKSSCFQAYIDLIFKIVQHKRKSEREREREREHLEGDE